MATQSARTAFDIEAMNTRLQVHQVAAKPAPTRVQHGILQRCTIAFGSSARRGPSCNVPQVVHEVLRSSGQPLDPATRAYMESRFAHNFGNVRVHNDTRAANSARAVNARAYTVGQQIVFGTNQFAPTTYHGRALLAHELAHAIQQEGGVSAIPGSILEAHSAEEKAATIAGERIRKEKTARVARTSNRILARQPKKDDKPAEETEEAKPVVPEGTMVSRILIDLRRGRVGFEVGGVTNYIMGTVSTDLRPGEYKVQLDAKKSQWNFRRGEVKVGQRFHVELEGADPWKLSYPEWLPVFVGFSSGKKGGAPTGETDADIYADILRIWDEVPGNIPEDPSIDGFVDFSYEAQIIEGTGKFSPMVTLHYLDGSEEQISIDAIDLGTEKPADAGATGKSATGRTVPGKLNCATTPNLCSMKKAVKRTQELLLQKWDAELLNEEFKQFTVVFGVLAQVGIMGANAKAFEITGKPANARGGLRGTGGKAAAGAATRIKPLNGTVNVGGGFEEGAEQVTNLNPIKPGTGGPAKGIANHVKAGFEEIDQVFEPGSVSKVISRKLPSSTVDWTRAAQGTAKVMAPGGQVRLNIWQLGEQDSALIKEAFEKAGFKNVKVLGKGSSVVLADW
jgi:hypothetical protein